MADLSFTEGGIRLSLSRYGSGTSLRLIFSAEDCHFACDGLEGIPKLQHDGTIAGGLTVWFDYKGVKLRKLISDSESVLEGFINSSHIKAKAQTIPAICPRYERVAKDGRPAFQIEPLPQFAEPFNPAFAALAAPVAEVAAKIRTNGKALSRNEIDDIVTRHLGSERNDAVSRVNGDVVAIRQIVAATDTVRKAEPPVFARASSSPNNRALVIASPSTTPAQIADVDSGDFEVPEQAVKDLKYFVDLLNKAMDDVSDRAIGLRIVNNRVEPFRRRLIEEPL